jgi:probable biosynthetic protein (TIGR04098 family)
MSVSQETIRVGMPHLDIFGLSEHFCLAHAGNLHWSWISRLTSKLPTEWRAEDGGRVYASFVYTSLEYDRDITAAEDAVISVECQPLALRAPFFVTETRYLKKGAGAIVTARMMSTFSAIDGRSNKRFIKSSIPFKSQPFGEAVFDSTRGRFRTLRAHDDKTLTKASDHLVNPSVDFNAAKFMYFANFCQLFKRYECPRLSAIAPVSFREVAYFGNVDPFERTTIFSRRNNMNVFSSMVRSSDQKCIARSNSTSVHVAECDTLYPYPYPVPA